MNAITTFTGKTFDFENYTANDICIEDIAHHLSLINRWVGASKYPLSVAYHSIFVSRLVPKGFKLQALLHDASEAYLGDVSRPLKSIVRDYKPLEEQLQRTIFRKFGCELDIAPEVHQADNLMWQWEYWKAFDNTPEPALLNWQRTILKDWSAASGDDEQTFLEEYNAIIRGY